MALKEFNIRLKVRADTEANWNTNSTEVLLLNELIIVTEIGDDKETKFKLGDGVKTYAELPFIEFGGSGGGAVESVNGMTGAVNLTAENIGALPVGGKAADSVKADTATVAAGLSATLPISQGGTSATTAAQARTNLGLGTFVSTVNGQSGAVTVSAGNKIVLSSSQPASGIMSSGDLWLKQL